MKIDELISELKQVKEEHGNLKVGINFDTFSFRDIEKLFVDEKYGYEKLFISES